MLSALSCNDVTPYEEKSPCPVCQANRLLLLCHLEDLRSGGAEEYAEEYYRWGGNTASKCE